MHSTERSELEQMIDDKLRRIADGIDEELKQAGLLDWQSGNPHMTAARMGARCVVYSIKKELTRGS